MRRAKPAAAPAGARFMELAIDPDHAREMMNQARLAGNAGQADSINATLARGGGVAMEIPLEEAIKMAVATHRGGKHKRAEAYYLQILEVAPNEAWARHFFGVLLHQTQRTREALTQIRRSLINLADQASAWNNLGNVLRESGEIDEAASAFRKAIELSPDFAAAHSNLGIVLRRQSKPDESEESYKRAIALQPEFVDAHYNYGKLLLANDRIPEAIESLSRAMVLSPKGAGQSRSALARAYLAIDDRAKAIELYREWVEAEPDDPTARHLLTACIGENVPDRAADDYVASTFDGFANSFDAKLAHLQYRAPELVADAFTKACGGARLAVVADAGCGTGLCAPLLRPFADRLVGVDLSGGMLAKAAERGGYDELQEAELTAFLAARPDAFDAVISADTLCYFGALEEFSRAAFASIKPGGTLVFTVEALPDDARPFVLLTNGRYAHSGAYVVRSLADAGFSVEPLRGDVLRKEIGKPVHGYIVVAKRAD